MSDVRTSEMSDRPDTSPKGMTRRLGLFTVWSRQHSYRYGIIGSGASLMAGAAMDLGPHSTAYSKYVETVTAPDPTG